MVFRPADADVVSGDAVDVVARLKQDSGRAKTGVFADSHPELGWLASKIHRAATVRDWLDGCPHDASDPAEYDTSERGNGYCRRSGEIPMYRRTSIRTALAAACRMAENPPPGKDPSWERS